MACVLNRHAGPNHAFTASGALPASCQYALIELAAAAACIDAPLLDNHLGWTKCISTKGSISRRCSPGSALRRWQEHFVEVMGSVLDNMPAKCCLENLVETDEPYVMWLWPRYYRREGHFSTVVNRYALRRRCRTTVARENLPSCI